MFVRHADQVSDQHVEMEGAEGVTLRLLVGREHGVPNFSLRHFTVSPGGHTPVHRHNYEHEVYVLSGRGLVRSGDTYRGFHPGTVVFLPRNELHQFKNTGDEPR